MIYLPEKSYFKNKINDKKLFDEFLGYQNCKDLQNREIKVAPVLRLYGANNFG